MAGLMQASLILLGFAVLVISNFLSIGLKKIEENWDQYRCSPAVMPLAGLLGKDPTENMAECIKQMQSEYMSVLLQPIDMNLNILGDIAGSITEKIGETMGFIDGLRDMIGTLTVGMFGAFSSILTGFSVSSAAIRDIVSRLTAVVFLILYSIQSLLYGGQSLWSGGPGKLVRALCFSPETLIELENGQHKAITNCAPGTVLKGGGIVRGFMELDNRHEDGGFHQQLYDYGCGSVSASHLVFDQKADKFIKSETKFGKKALRNGNCETLYCLITSNHIIPSGGYIFHDWEDNNGSPSKSL